MEGLRLAWAPAPSSRDGRRAVAWGLIRDLLRAEAVTEVRLTNPCPQCGGPHGPVRVEDAAWRAGVTYAGRFAVVGVVPGAGGGFAVDAEPLHDTVREAAGGVPGGVRRWVRVEAALKAVGTGLRIDAASVRLEESADGARWFADVPGVATTVHGVDLDGPPGILLSAAVVDTVVDTMVDTASMSAR